MKIKHRRIKPKITGMDILAKVAFKYHAVEVREIKEEDEEVGREERTLRSQDSD